MDKNSQTKIAKKKQNRKKTLCGTRDMDEKKRNKK